MIILLFIHLFITQVEAFRRAPPEKNYNDIIDQLLKDLSELVITPISSKK